MFKNIISQLSFSPVTVERLGDYAKSVQRRQYLHGWTAIVLALLIIAQVATILLPAASVTTSTANDLVPGGLPSRETLLSAYDNNSSGFKDTAELFSINRENIVAATFTNNCSIDVSSDYSTGRVPYFSSTQETVYKIQDEPLYVQPISSNRLPSGWCGTSSQNKTFLISSIDGNILSPLVVAQVALHTDLSKSLTVDIEKVEAGEVVTWNPIVTNTTSKPISEDIWFSLGDLNEYAHVANISDGGITTNDGSHILWPHASINPGEHRKFEVSAYIDSPTDTTARQPYNSHSYDCLLTASFGNITETAVSCPTVKQIESSFHKLYTIEPLTCLAIYAVLFALNLITYLSLRLRSREIRIIRRQLNTGGL